MKDTKPLEIVADNARVTHGAKAALEEEAAQWVAKRLAEYQEQLEQSVLEALESGWSISAVARAYTRPGKTPNRNAIYEILSRHPDRERQSADSYPFRWAKRETKTVAGTKTVFDIVAKAEDFGPKKLTGEFRWLYDRATNQPDPVLTEDDPYPVDDGFYKNALGRWLQFNPYPGRE